MARSAAIAAIVLFLVALPFTGVPFVTEKRQSIAASPSLSGFATNKNVRVRAGQRACVSPVPFDRPTQIAQFLIAPQKPGHQSPLVVTASAPGVQRWSVAVLR